MRCGWYGGRSCYVKWDVGAMEGGVGYEKWNVGGMEEGVGMYNEMWVVWREESGM